MVTFSTITTKIKEGIRWIRISRLLILFNYFILSCITLSVAVVLCLRWVSPPTSAMMMQQYLAKFLRGEKQTSVRYKWVDWELISRWVPLAAVASEDQKFFQHWGFDVEAITEAMERNKKSSRLRGGSTITQQVAKNLFLWSDRSYVRKGLETYFTILLELLWPKKRILEVYLNIAEFGRGIYGVNAASESLFGKSPRELTRSDSALLMAVLPNPKRMKAKNPSPYVRERAYWIEKQMEQLGGEAYVTGFKEYSQKVKR